MREHLYRGKTKDGRWVFGFYINYSAFEEGVSDSTEIIRHSIKRYDGGDIEDIDPKSVGEYTGLKDKNGVKIFEGDILEWGHHKHICRVKWLDDTARFLYITTDKRLIYPGEAKACEVIGNIHDNGYLINAD